VFKALADETRLEILRLLGGGERCACMLLEDLNVGQSSLSYHMKILCEAGLIESHQQGKWTHYNISREGSDAAKTLLETATQMYVPAQEVDSSCCKEAM
jgi:ArsR family transcriptional regulator